MPQMNVLTGNSKPETHDDRSFKSPTDASFFLPLRITLLTAKPQIESVFFISDLNPPLVFKVLNAIHIIGIAQIFVLLFIADFAMGD